MEQTTLQNKKDELFNILLLGYGLPSLLEAISTYLKKPITLCTTNFNIIASTTSVQRTIHFQEEAGNRYLNNQAIDRMQSSRLLEQVQHSWQPIHYRFSNDPQRDYLFIGIHIRQHILAYLCLDGARDSLTEEDSVLLEELAKAVAIEMQKAGFFQEKSGLSQEYLLIDLLEGNIQNNDFAQYRLASFGLRQNDYYQIALISAEKEMATGTLTGYYLTELSHLFPCSLTACYNGAYVILLSGTTAELEQRCHDTRFWQFAKINHLTMAASYRFQELASIRAYYEQALYTAATGRNKSALEPRTYTTCSFQHLCSIIEDKDALAAMIHPDILFLQQHDRTNHTEYIATLMA